MNKGKVLFVVMMLLAQWVLGQEVRNIRFHAGREGIVISYDLVGAEMAYCDIAVQVHGKSNGPLEVSEEALSGDLFRQRPGTNKIIRWDVLHDLPYLDDEINIILFPVNVQMRDRKPQAVETGYAYQPSSSSVRTAAQLNKFRGLGGPGNALKSMVWPGWGDLAVNGPDHRAKGTLIMLTYAGVVGFGAYSKVQSDAWYEKYMAAVDQAEIDEYYELANDYHQKFLLAAGSAALIWVVDVLYVFGRGIRNKSAQRKLRKISLTPGAHNVQLTYRF
jgi:hypothetical protein